MTVRDGAGTACDPQVDVRERRASRETAQTLLHGETFREAAPIWVAAYGVEVAGCWFVQWFADYPLHTEWILQITLAEVLGLILCYPRAVRSVPWACIYLAWEATCQNAIFYFMGDLRIALVALVYALILVVPGMRLGRVGHYLLANALVLFYSGLTFAENSGILLKHGSPKLILDPDLALKTTTIVFLCVNVAAFVISEVKRLFAMRSAELVAAKQSLETRGAELEQRVGERTAQLEASFHALQDKQDELKAFAYIVSHDLKNPVNAVLLTADLLLQREGAALSPRGRDDLESIVRLAGGTEDMIRDLLTLFKVVSARENPSWVDLDGLVATALDTLRPEIEAKGVRVETTSLPRVWGQSEKLGHVVVNLLSNAVKYVSAGCGIVQVSSAAENGQVLLSVSDNGIGIPKIYHDRVFKLFGRVPPNEQQVDGEAVVGTGVGLAIVKRIVETHGGNVSVESESGVGSRFCVRLPASASDRDDRNEG